jgi:hypothetical protein
MRCGGISNTILHLKYITFAGPPFHTVQLPDNKKFTRQSCLIMELTILITKLLFWVMFLLNP